MKIANRIPDFLKSPLRSRRADRGPSGPVDEVVLSGSVDPFLEQEKRQRCWGFNFVFGSVASLVAGAIALAGVGKRKKKKSESAEVRPDPLVGQPSADLKRPFVFVPGFNSSEAQFRPLLEKLTSTPVFVQGGRFYRDFACEQEFQPENPTVFVARFERMDQSPDLTAPQLAEDLQAIVKATGSAKVDVVGYSMGGLATRAYLDDLGQSGATSSPIENFAMLGTPNHGSALAKLSSWLAEVREEGYPVQPILDWKGVKESDREATHWLRPVDGRRANLHLLDLNRRWPMQRSLVSQAVAMGSDSKKKTYSTYVWPQRGDGVVTIKSVGLPGIPCRVFRSSEFGHHNSLPTSPQSYAAMGELFGWFK